ncbi:MAG: gamma-glutamylcyclotransferase [Planctomycetota bacterium]|nr:gamma-glutamylcyclotransferase [Planctomycetota bacterium]MDA1213770.1 gamma-glutamylcyclotransferase [Planctomycetota bacterium]
MSSSFSHAPLPLFVYGTLRQGQCNHHYLHGKYSRRLIAKLPGFHRVHPIMVMKHPTASVEGELYFIKPELYRKVMEACDLLEELHPGQTVGPDYRRICLPVETAEGIVDAWAYVHRDTVM